MKACQHEDTQPKPLWQFPIWPIGGMTSQQGSTSKGSTYNTQFERQLRKDLTYKPTVPHLTMQMKSETLWEIIN